MTLSATDIHFAYGSHEVLSGITLEIHAGEILSLLGLNGAGKSTLLRILAGALTPAQGTVSIEGKDVHTTSARERGRKIAFVPQESSIPFSFTALEMVLMGRTPYVPRLGFESHHDLTVAHEAMQATDCNHLASREIHTLSGGERRRVIMARALAQEARWLLLDEPMSFLDVAHSASLAILLKRLAHERGLAVVMVMHDLNLAAAVSDRIAILQAGKIMALGHPREVITAEHMALAFGTKVAAGIDAASGMPYCLQIMG